MALTLENQTEFASNEILRKRVAMAFYRVAREVIEEDPNIAGHPLRVRLAQIVYMSNYDEFFKYGSVIASDPDIINADPQSVEDVTDIELINVVRQNWNAICGYFPEPDPATPAGEGIAV